MTTLAIPLVFLLFLVAIQSTVSTDLFSEYAHHAALDGDERMKLFWTIDWDAETVSFAVEAETTGWVGLGFSGSSQMSGSDVVIGWVKDGKGFLTDRYADSRSLPPVDEQQDYQLTGFQESGGKTVLKFKRKFDTCDPRDRKLEKGSTKLVFAYHSEDPVSQTEIKYHEFRGARTILLMGTIDRRTIDESGWKAFNLTIENVRIPTEDTTYWCTLLKGPGLKSKHHITKVVPLIQKGNEGFVHHMILYECDGNFNESDFNQGIECYSSANMPFLNCRSSVIVGGWAVGGDAMYFPEHVGQPIGGNDFPKHFLLEMHYDNPQLIEGAQDNSGFSVYYTDKLRRYDSAIMAVGIGVSNWHIIPPKQENWLSVGYCMHQCSESYLKSSNLPKGGINIFATLLHTHLAGRATWTKHIRNGKELPEIARDDNYDFNFQDLTVLRKEINVQPGDDIIHYCKYDSTARDQMIRGGLSTREEMCLDFFWYYPRIPSFRSCYSIMFQPEINLVEKYFGKVNTTDFENPLVTRLVDWTEEMATDLKKFESDVKTVIPGCWLESGNITSMADIRGPKFKVPIPEITQPLPPPKTCFVTSGTETHTSFVLLSGLLCAVTRAL